jgi:hypothetical protein
VKKPVKLAVVISPIPSRETMMPMSRRFGRPSPKTRPAKTAMISGAILTIIEAVPASIDRSAALSTTT